MVINQLLYSRASCSAARRYCKWLNDNEISSFDIPFFPGFAHCVRTSRPACGGACQKQRPAQRSSKLDAVQVSAFAERTGFEPVSRFRRLHAFQACLFSHSSIFPELMDCKDNKKICSVGKIMRFICAVCRENLTVRHSLWAFGPEIFLK